MIDLDLKQKIILGLKYPITATNFLTDKIFYRGRETPFPRLINCFITERCNFNCPMCHVKESRIKKMADLSFADLKSVFREAAKFFPSFQLTGGEPLLHPELISIIRFLTKNHMVKGIVTNGLLLGDLAEELVNSGLDFLAISLDGPDEKTQFKRGYVKNSFEKIERGIKKIIKVRGGRLFPNIRVATVVSEFNLENFDKILSIAEEWEADQWSVSHFFYYPKQVRIRQKAFAKKYDMGEDIWGEQLEKGEEWFDQKQREKVKNKFLQILDYRNSGKSKVRISFQPEVDIDKYYSGAFPSKNSVCSSPYNQIFIRGNGDVEMCQGYNLGNIKKDKIKDIWLGKKAQHFREVFSQVGVMQACFRCCALEIKFD